MNFVDNQRLVSVLVCFAFFAVGDDAAGGKNRYLISVSSPGLKLKAPVGQVATHLPQSSHLV